MAYTLLELEGRFTSFSENGGYHLNTDYLNDMIRLYLDNVQDIYNNMTNPRRKPEGVAWSAFRALADGYINEDFSEPNTIFYATSQQLRDFLKEYGYGYEAIAESVEYVKETRKELQEEKKHVPAQI